ncbi:NUDIX domain-containing protein [Kitasatospora sp. NA04385]|uniref:NUDIX hydrolase n=1 Tax=Kitasatospora sp. NA04385 TaxID=2742135 RepID=UPI00158FBFB0|nr:NUDIX domain-containing protein [Kitasatospora sp. NA04385]QKW21755.1 NUDIX domain-containing protein [Kitasatospora sp. NA04385]
MVEHRRAVRVLLLDPEDRVLLLRGMDPAEPGTTWWITPGGGIEPGEGPEEAARRELAEEIGLTDVDWGPLVAYGTAEFSFRGREYRQEQWFRLARTTRTAVSLAESGADEHALLLALRWWTLGELRTTGETVHPRGLARLVARVLTDGPPEQPVRL